MMRGKKVKRLGKVCSVKGCGQDVWARGFCQKHYTSARRSEQIQKREFPTKCSVENCDNLPKGLGLCQMHYSRFRTTGVIGTAGKKKPHIGCAVEGCDGQNHRTGYCRKHYNRILKYGTTELPIKEIKLCSIAECENKCYCRGYCELHYGRVKRTGSPLLKIKEVAKLCKEENCMKPSRSRGFCDMHYSIARRHGIIECQPRKNKQPTRLCEVEGCNRKHVGKGYCGMHYTRWSANGTMELINNYTYIPSALTKADAVSYYLLGVFMSDGCVKERGNSYTCAISSADKDWLEIINPYLSLDKQIEDRIRLDEVRAIYYEVTYHSREMGEWLVSKGCTPRKSLTLQMPEVPKKYLVDFIRGIWCGDGTLGIYRGIERDGEPYVRRSASLATASLDFANAMVEALGSLDIKACKRQYKRKNDRKIRGRIVIKNNPIYRVDLSSGEDVYKFCKLIYPPSVKLVLPRKQQVAQNIVVDWEREFRCVSCNDVLCLTKSQRNTKYCDDCRPTDQDYQMRRSAKKLNTT